MRDELYRQSPVQKVRVGPEWSSCWSKRRGDWTRRTLKRTPSRKPRSQGSTRRLAAHIFSRGLFLLAFWFVPVGLRKFYWGTMIIICVSRCWHKYVWRKFKNVCRSIVSKITILRSPQKMQWNKSCIGPWEYTMLQQLKSTFAITGRKGHRNAGSSSYEEPAFLCPFEELCRTLNNRSISWR